MYHSWMPQLIESQFKVLFQTDANGHLTNTRDPCPKQAPRFFLSRSAESILWAVRHDLSSDLAEQLIRLARQEEHLQKPNPKTLPTIREQAINLLNPVEAEWHGPAFVLPDSLPNDDRARCLAPNEDIARVLQSFPWITESPLTFAPIAVAFCDGVAASVCHSPRGRTEYAAEAGVVTLEAYRGRGLATAAVASWARAVQKAGLLALYSTSWSNSASLRVAGRLSAQIYGENWHIT